MQVVGMWISIIIVNAFLDVVYAKYTMAVQARKASASANWAGAIILLGGVSILSYTHDPLLILPAAIGAWIGTYWTIEHEGD